MPILAILLLAPLSAPAAAWTLDDVRASHRVHASAAGAAPGGDLTAVTVDGRRGTLFDGPRRVGAWNLGGGAPAAVSASTDARHLFVLAADGRIRRLRLPGLALEAELRSGLRASGLAASADGRYLLVANDEPPSLVLLRAADLAPLRLIDGADRRGRRSRFAWLGVAARRESFLAALADAPELWEIAYADDPAPVFPGLVHDYRLGEGLALQGAFPVRPIELPAPIAAAVAGPRDENLVALPAGGGDLRVINLLVGREIRRLPGTASVGTRAIAAWRQGERAWAAVGAPPGIAWFDLLDGARIAEQALPRPAAALRSDPHGARLWAVLAQQGSRPELVVSGGPGAGLHRLSLDMPHGGVPALHFSADGAWAYVSGGPDGRRVQVIDARTLARVTSAR